mgnify:CR=1 FL=1|tara:strand:- start:693 stop:2009 length:1317 start_codon:yes stop_codon:yes gene_type:complete
MSLSNTVRTTLLDPRISNDQRCEFRLEDGFYASSLKLIDLGVFDAGLSGAEGVFYPTITGVMSIVKNIFLYSDTTLIDSLQNVAQYVSVQALKTSNQGSTDLNNQLILNGMGFRGVSAEPQPTPGSNNAPALGRPGALALGGRDMYSFNTIGGKFATNNQVPIPAAERQQSGSVLLSQYLQFLKTVSMLPNIPDLRLVIEWDTNAASYYPDPDTANAITLALKVMRPTLVVDEILNVDPSEGENFSLPYLSTIVERFVVPTAQSELVPTRSSYKSQAFTSKFVKDIMFFNLPAAELAAADRWLTRTTRSVAQDNETLQLVVNHKNHLPDQGITSLAQKYHYFNEAQTQLNLPLVAGTYGIQDTSGNIAAPSAAPLVGQYSVTAVKIGQTVNDLRIEYARTKGDTPSSGSDGSGFTLLAFGTVAKTLTKQGNGMVRVSY